jgi:uncharacterized membrane protein YcjF (UPF0283 family)
VSYWARRTAFGTAVAPNAVADTGLTLYFSFALLADLCTIYNLRAGRLGTMVLLTRVFFNSYLAGQMRAMMKDGKQMPPEVQALLKSIKSVRGDAGISAHPHTFAPIP